MRYSEVLDSVREQAGGWTASIPEDWLQGRSVFGGLQVALALRAMRSLVPRSVPLRTVQTTFLAPVPAGEVQLRAQILRAGKSATHVEARLMDREQTLCVVIGVFGVARPSAVRISPVQPPVECDKPIAFPFIPGITPDFTRHFAVRWLRGGLPFTSSTSLQNVVEIGLRDEGRASEEHVLAIADFIPPIALSMLKQPVAGSSMTWMLEFLDNRVNELPLLGWRMDAELSAARDGYTSQTGMLWGPDGRAVALSRQSMVVFA